MAKQLQPYELTKFYGKLLCRRCFHVDTLPLVLYPLEIIGQLLCVIVHLLILLCRTPYLSWVTLKLMCTKVTESGEGALFNFCDEPKNGFEVESLVKECKDLISRFVWELDGWAFKKGVKEMRRLMIMNTSKPSIHLIQLLRKTPPSPVSLATSLQNQRLQSSEDYRICPFSILVLAKIITLSIPSTMSQCIYDSFEEFLVAVRYVDKKDGSDYKLFEDTHDFEVVWGDLYFGFFGKKLRHEEDFPSQMQLDQALQIIRDVKRESRNARHISVREDLYLYMEKLFVDMIRELLVQLADIMLKEIVESSCEDLEDKVKEALKVVCKFEQLRDLDAHCHF
ncbi:hypothetical protein Syun_006213 [Stephania yunnanensis]|uniref:Uncharacterized protein n=1 Tax=Stephania yunnanensis TaxID=152371 RepID=A0AAP0KXV1_9MAGN